MAAPAWLKKYLKMKPEVSKIYEDLENYREFCVKQGYVFDEAHLYNEKTPWGEWQRVLAGKFPRTTGVHIQSLNGLTSAHATTTIAVTDTNA